VNEENGARKSGSVRCGPHVGCPRHGLLLLDAYAPLKAGITFARGAAGRAALKAGSSMAHSRASSNSARPVCPRKAAQSIVERAVNEVGVEQTLKRANLTAEKLLEQLPADSPARARILAFEGSPRAASRQSRKCAVCCRSSQRKSPPTG